MNETLKVFAISWLVSCFYGFTGYHFDRILMRITGPVSSISGYRFFFYQNEVYK